jgi:excisionase family DNA binding protein
VTSSARRSFPVEANAREEIMTEEQTLTVRQVADRLNLRTEAVRRWLRDGRLHGTRAFDRGNWHITESELQRFIAGAVTVQDDADEG